MTGLFVFFLFHAPGPVQSRPSFRHLLGKLDPIGTILFLPAIVCLLLALQWGGNQYAWGNWRIIVLFVVAGVLLLAFGGCQVWQGDDATLPPRVLRNRNIWSSAWFALTLNGAYFVFTYYVSCVRPLPSSSSPPLTCRQLPIWFQSIKSASATKSGVMSLPSILAVVLVSILSGVTVTLFGYYNPFMVLASTILAVGAGLLSTLQPNSGPGQWISYQILEGIGVGLGQQLPFVVVQNVLPDRDVPTGTAVVTFAQTLGGAIFISVAQSVFTNQFTRVMHVEDPSVNVTEILAAGTTTLRQKLRGDQLETVLRSYNSAVTQAFYVGVALAALSVFGTVALEWRSVKETEKPAPGEGDAR